MVFRVYVEKKKPLAQEAKALTENIREFLGISGLEKARLLNRYDLENISRELFDYAVKTVLSEPQLDDVFEELPSAGAAAVFAVEYLPGQYDQRADSAAQCIQILSQGERPEVRSARVYMLFGDLTEADVAAIRNYVINPVDSRIAELGPVDTLAMSYEVPETVKTLSGFIDMADGDIPAFIAQYGLAMDEGDVRCCRKYFRSEGRDPTLTEIRMIDTYWSDHCRHTTFNTLIEDVTFEDDTLCKTYEEYLAARKALGRESKPITLMDMGTIAARSLKASGELRKLDESEEINACTVKIKVTVDGEEQDWLLLFKNETHNHPTEIEPFGGAATCIGGAIRDPLSGRSYVYAAMRVTGGADPLRPLDQTLPGKLPQRKLVTTAAAGYSSYGNQIGLATGLVDELYHDGYAAKRLEIGAVIAAAPAKNVRRERPAPGDVVILLGGRTGRDGCGGATGSSKSHTLHSLEECGAEVQKGNAPEERKLQRLFRNPEASRLIKRCNDFGAGGVSVAVGELADGLDIDLNKVPKKYEGLDGTELAISESQERMAVVVALEDAERFCELADAENLEATVIAAVKAEPRLTMTWNGRVIVDVARAFLDTNGAEKRVSVRPAAPRDWKKPIPSDFASGYSALAGDLNICSRRGLSERFDSTIGAGTVFMPFGGKRQMTPIQTMVHTISVEDGHTDDCSFMSWGYNPSIADKSPYHAAYLAVVESVSKLIAAGASFKDVYLTFQEYFAKPGRDPALWGDPFAALMGAFRAQMGLRVAAIGGKDSMSGTFEDLTVPPTLVSFAVTTGKTGQTVSNEFKGPGHDVVILRPDCDAEGLPKAESLRALYDKIHGYMSEGKILAAYTPTLGGPAEAIFKMCLGNGVGFRYEPDISLDELFSYAYGAFILELAPGAKTDGILLGRTMEEYTLSRGEELLSLDELQTAYENKLEPVYPCNIQEKTEDIPAFSYTAAKRAAAVVGAAKPRVLIPIFPGTNCEYDTAKVLRDAGAEPVIEIIANRTAEHIAASTERFAAALDSAQMIFIPGGFSGGDEPDGSAKFITAFFRNERIKAGVEDLLDKRGGLMAGICNGFQALIKLGLVPYGRIIDTDEHCPTLTYNSIGRHQSRLVRTRICSDKSPWLAGTKVGEIYTVPISHGEGRFLADRELILKLAENGQIATQYVDLNGDPTDDVRFNPNNSVLAVEGITSPDGRVLGKMGHSERIGPGLYRNVDGNYDMHLFESAVRFFRNN